MLLVRRTLCENKYYGITLFQCYNGAAPLLTPATRTAAAENAAMGSGCVQVQCTLVFCVVQNYRASGKWFLLVRSSLSFVQ